MPRMQKAVALLLLLITMQAMLAPAAIAADVKNLYGSQGVRPEAVLQGVLGSCYFHSVIAAIAATHPSSLESAIHVSDSGAISVRFADGKSENVYMDDVLYARKSGFDRSDGLWVAILFRAFAQRTLREALISALAASDLPPLIKTAGAGFFSSGDMLLLAYDRSIRAQISQNGDIDRDQLEKQLNKEMASVSLSSDTRQAILKMIDSRGYFDALAAEIKTRGELFGAYRAVGQGGLPKEVLAAFTGSGRSAQNRDDMIEVLRMMGKTHLPVTASTGTSAAPVIVSRFRALRGAPDWYVASHAYTVLDFDPSQSVVTVRNPWGTRPDPGGKFTLPLDAFLSSYVDVSYSDAE